MQNMQSANSKFLWQFQVTVKMLKVLNLPLQLIKTFNPPRGSRACQSWGRKEWGSLIQTLASMSLFRFLPVKEISLEVALKKQHLNDRDVPVSLQRLLNVPQQMLLVHTRRSMDMCVHLSNAHMIFFYWTSPLSSAPKWKEATTRFFWNRSCGQLDGIFLFRYWSGASLKIAQYDCPHQFLSIKRLVTSPCAHCRNPYETQPSVQQVRGSRSGDCEADTWLTRSVFGRFKVVCCFW